MKKLLIYRANAEIILGKDACAAKKEKEHRQLELILLHGHP